jgi:RND family efflux transporter MFP subunit
MAQTLRDDLASLKIERPEWSRAPRRSSDRGVGVASVLLWLIPLGLLAGAGAIGYQQYQRLKPRTEVSVVRVQAMTMGESEKLLSAKGYIKSRHQAMIGAKVPGRVVQMDVEEGSKVKKGDVLAVLEHNDLDAILESRRATVARTESELEEARVGLRDKERKARRESRLMSGNHSSQETLDQANAERDMAAARVKALEAALKLMQASARETEETIRNMHIIAPFDGTVIGREAEVGETITPGGMGGASGRGSVATLADLNRLEVETDVAENHLGLVKTEQPAEITVSAVPGRHYRGRLRQIIPMGDRARGTVKLKVEILDADERLFPELVATVNFLPSQSQAAATTGRTFLFVPRAALVEDAGRYLAWVVDAKGKIQKRKVEASPSSAELARVDFGLSADEAVVVNPKANLREGEAVQVAD